MRPQSGRTISSDATCYFCEFMGLRGLLNTQLMKELYGYLVPELKYNDLLYIAMCCTEYFCKFVTAQWIGA